MLRRVPGRSSCSLSSSRPGRILVRTLQSLLLPSEGQPPLSLSKRFHVAERSSCYWKQNQSASYEGYYVEPYACYISSTYCESANCIQPNRHGDKGPCGLNREWHDWTVEPWEVSARKEVHWLL